MIVGMAGETTSCSIAVTIIATSSAAVTRRRPASADPLVVSSTIVASNSLSLVAGGMSGIAPGFPGDRGRDSPLYRGRQAGHGPIGSGSPIESLLAKCPP